MTYHDNRPRDNVPGTVLLLPELSGEDLADGVADQEQSIAGQFLQESVLNQFICLPLMIKRSYLGVPRDDARNPSEDHDEAGSTQAKEVEGDQEAILLISGQTDEESASKGGEQEGGHGDPRTGVGIVLQDDGGSCYTDNRLYDTLLERVACNESKSETYAEAERDGEKSSHEVIKAQVGNDDRVLGSSSGLQVTDAGKEEEHPSLGVTKSFPKPRK